MSVGFEDGIVRLRGACPLEEAEDLAALLADHPGAAVDLSACESAHSAVLQALLSFRPPLAGAIGDPLVAEWLKTSLSAANPAFVDESVAR